MREPPTETIRSTGWNVSSQVPDSQGYPDPPARGPGGARGVVWAASHGLQAREPGPGSLHRQREAAPRLFAAFGPSEAPPRSALSPLRQEPPYHPRGGPNPRPPGGRGSGRQGALGAVSARKGSSLSSGPLRDGRDHFCPMGDGEGRSRDMTPNVGNPGEVASK